MRHLKFMAGFCSAALCLGLLSNGGLALRAGAQVPASTPPKTILTDGAFLDSVRQSSDPAILRRARSEADKALQAPLLSVMDKQSTPPSGDKHDYMSLAPYWWPNPATPNHLPYIRKDGVHNPEASAVKDHDNLTHMAENVHALAMGYFFTRDESYARRAAEQLRVWFLDPSTRMNPSLKYAQAVLGVNEGRGTGILDARSFADVVDALALLGDSPSWSVHDRAALHTWFDTYFTWLTTSAAGKDEAAAKNNHGCWYDTQAAAIALYLGKAELAHDLTEAAKSKRIAAQIQPDGQQPLEEARTRSFHYCVFNLQALVQLATEAQSANVDLWTYQAPAGGSIRKALEYLLSFSGKEKTWEHQDLDGVSIAPLRDSLLIAATHYGNADYETAARKIPGSNLTTLLLERQYAVQLSH